MVLNSTISFSFSNWIISPLETTLARPPAFLVEVFIAVFPRASLFFSLICPSVFCAASIFAFFKSSSEGWFIIEKIVKTNPIKTKPVKVLRSIIFLFYELRLLERKQQKGDEVLPLYFYILGEIGHQQTKDDLGFL